VADKSIERGQFVGTGSPVLTLADDSLLEIVVSLNSRQARNWLLFDNRAASEDSAWFNALAHVGVKIAWTEHPEEAEWNGTLARVERFDEDTRTLSVVVSVPGADAAAPTHGALPLVDGMFCRVSIPGRVAKHVVRLPAECVAFDRDASGYRTLYIAHRDPETNETRLMSRKVKESHVAGDDIFIAEGLNPGDRVITTRLVSPLESSLLDVTEVGAVGTGS
jgi:multidrug efflux pump subunit AcrA (membrane-fusion protein)